MSKFGVPTDEQLAKINNIAKRTLSADEVFAFSGKSAGDMMIPGRYTVLSPDFLQVMVDDAKKSVSFMLNHNWSNRGIQGVPYGKVFDGRIVPSSADGETVEMHLDKYIVRDDEIIDNVSANALIKRIETGVLSDTSIGFSTDKMVCSICGMDYWGGQCSHYRGREYELADGTKKVCFVTAKPPSVIIPYNNNALYEESIVWDGAYPGAIVTQSKHGDIVETPSGKFSILEDKEELPANTPILGHYHNGNIITMVKKGEKKKLFKGADIKDTKGSEKNMDEKALKILVDLGFTTEETESLIKSEITEILNAISDKWAEQLQTAEAGLEGEELEINTEYLGIPLDEMTEMFGEGILGDEVLKLAKEGQEYRKELTSEATAMGVRAMGNDFPAETWEKNFTNMDVKSIKDTMATWELQAKEEIPAGRKSDPSINQTQGNKTPDDAFKV